MNKKKRQAILKQLIKAKGTFILKPLLIVTMAIMKLVKILCQLWLHYLGLQ